MVDITKEMLISEFFNTNYKRSKKALSYIENSLIVTGSNNITLRKVDVKPHEFDKVFMEKDLIEVKLYQIIDRFNNKKITSVKFYSIHPSKVHPFYDENGRTYKILFANNDKTTKLIDWTKN